MSIKDKLNLADEPVFLMDGTAYIYRSFYANRHLRRSDGFPTNAIILVARILLRILREERPRYFLFAMDGKGPTFRKKIYEQYKANRGAMPEELVVQIEPIIRMVEAFGIHKVITTTCEADDCIASLAAKFSTDHPIIIVSGDKDLKQCLKPNVFMWDPSSKEEHLLTQSDFEAESGVTPSQWPDVQAIVGDSIDNIPGVPGIGSKTARQIFQTCPNLEAIRDNLSLLPPKIQIKLNPHIKEMFKWRELTTLRTDQFKKISLKDIETQKINLKVCGDIIKEFELSSITRSIDSLARADLLHNKKQTNTTTENRADLITSKNDAKFLSTTEVTISNRKDLPDCHNRIVSFICPLNCEGNIYVAISTENINWADPSPLIHYMPPYANEFIWNSNQDKQQEDICEWLENAAGIVVADLKSLMSKYTSWEKLFDKKQSFFDLGLASYLINPEEGDYSWARMSSRWKIELNSENENPASLALTMFGALWNKLETNNLDKLYSLVEMPLIRVLVQMEKIGFAISPEAFQSLLTDVTTELEQVIQDIYQQAGVKFNIRSAKQLGEILYSRLKPTSIKKTKGGQPSTSQETLEKLAVDEPLAEKILQFRKLDKMRSTYLSPLPRLKDTNNRIHTTFNQEATATGRLSSSNPNLQNIPVTGLLGKRMRACFVPAANNLLIAADYSQIELRVLAHLSQDQTLLQSFKNGLDIHASTASLIFEQPQETINSDQRRMAKTINFGLLYGMGAQKLAIELKITVNQAKDFIERYFEKLKELKSFYENIIEQACEKGYVTTMTGRKRMLPEIYSVNAQNVAQAKRQAINTVIQGSAADIIKLAMLEVAKNQRLKDMGAKLVLQVHDELLLESPENNATEVGYIVEKIMSSVKPNGIQLSIPLLVDWGTGTNWALAH